MDDMEYGDQDMPGDLVDQMWAQMSDDNRAKLIDEIDGVD